MAAVQTDFRPQATYWITIAGLVLITPFAVYQATIGRGVLSALGLGILLCLIGNAWHCRRIGRVGLLAVVTQMPLLIVFVLIATHRLHEIGVLWCFPVILAIYCMVPERWAIGGNLLLLALQFPIVWQVLEPAVAVRACTTLATVSLFTAILVRVISRQQRALHQALITDHLTGCLNRVTLEGTLEAALGHAAQTGQPATLFALDIDRFKRINDEAGHAAGDEVLRRVAQVLLEQCRPGERVFRTGGEEFLCVLGRIDERAIGERIGAWYEAIAAARPLPDREVTVSVGVAVLRPGETADEWTGRADAALYEAKDGGRDRFALAA